MEQTQQQEALRPNHNIAYASLFGDFQLTTADGAEILISNRRARALLAMLCLLRTESIDRDYVSRLLWPGRFEAHAKASLRQCLLDLGKLLAAHECNILVVTRGRIGLNTSFIQTDLGNLEDALIQHQYTEVAEQLMVTGTNSLLDQMDFGDAFKDWIAKHRLEAERRLRAAMMDGLSLLEANGDMAQHAKLLNAWSAHDPSARSRIETVYFADMSTDKTNEKASDKVRIAVLPFHSPDAKEGHDYFADGMVDELITTLGQVPQLRVAGRTSSFHFRGSDLSPAQIATELGVTHLIEGSVQREWDRVRIHAHLIAGETGFELWGQRFDGTLDDVFAFQEKVAQAITAAMGNALGIAMQPPRATGMTQSKQAYDLYLQGRSLCLRIFGDGVLDTAIALFEQALALDPEFAECWVALAEAHQLVAMYTQCLDREAESVRMAECARKAIALSATLGYPHALLGLHQWTRKDVVGALDHAFKAYQLEPGNPDVALRLGSFLIYCGRTRDAATYVKAAVDQDPVDPRKYAPLWAMHMGQGDLDAARAAAQRMVDLGFPPIYLAISSAALGEHDLAVEQYQSAKALMNTIIKPPVGTGTMTSEAMDAYWLMAAKGVCSGRDEDRKAYWHMLDFMYATLPDKSDHAITGPAIFTGHAELAFKAIGDHGSLATMLPLLSLWADIDPIRQVWQHPEFIPFAQKIGMAAAWDKYGWPDLLPPPSNLSSTS
jgi:TolB-like protein